MAKAELPSNSHKYHENQQKNKKEKLKKITKGPVKMRTRPMARAKSMAENFLSVDIDEVKDSFYKEVVKPSILEWIGSLLKQAIDAFFQSDGPGRYSSSSKSRPYERVSYRSYSERDERPGRDRESTKVKKFKEYYDIILDSYAEAEEVLESMRNVIEQYDRVTLADYHDLCGVTSQSWTDNKYGWEDLTTASVKFIRGQGYIVDLPKAYALDD